MAKKVTVLNTELGKAGMKPVAPMATHNYNTILGNYQKEAAPAAQDKASAPAGMINTILGSYHTEGK